MRWFKVMVDGVEAFMLVDGDVVSYYTLAGDPLAFTEGTAVVIENDVAGPL